jgi:proteasome accessory factor C
VSSERTARRLSRILAVLPWVIEHPGTPVAELVERFGYGSKEDLVKDLHLVFVTGLPGYGPGDLIDVDILEDEVWVDAADYFSNPVPLTAPEALGLLAAAMTMLESDQAPSALATAVDKLITVIGPEAGEAVAFDVPTPASVTTLSVAIDGRRAVRIDYLGLASNERTTRVVEGWSVSFSLGNWYLTGHCRLAGAERVFRVDRITSVEVLDEHYDIPPGRPVGPIRYRPAESDERVSFTVGPDARWVAEYYPVEAAELDDGSLRVTMSVSDPLVAARLLLALGYQASDIEGRAVLEAQERLRGRILTRYERAN